MNQKHRLSAFSGSLVEAAHTRLAIQPCAGSICSTQSNFMACPEHDLPAGAEATRGQALPGRIVHVHIPKTAGSAVFAALRRAYGNRLRVYPERYEARFQPRDFAGHNFFTGHFGYNVANEIGGNLITVLRDPLDRFLSTYFFLRQRYASGAEVSHKTSLAAHYDLHEFVKIRGEPVLDYDFDNRMTWQIAYTGRMKLRRELIEGGVTDEQLVRTAIGNLQRFAVVGLQTEMNEFAEAIRQRYGVAFLLEHVNVTASRLAPEDISSKLRDQIEPWIHLDQKVWSTWLHRLDAHHNDKRRGCRPSSA